MKLEDRIDIASERRRLMERSHRDHEFIVQRLQSNPDPVSVPYLERAIHLKPELSYLDGDEHGDYYKTCLIALQAIGTEEALAVIRQCSSAKDEALRRQAAFRLEHIAKEDASKGGPKVPGTDLPAVHSVGALAVAGFIGGPLAMGYLAYHDFSKLRVQQGIRAAVVLFAIAVVSRYCLLSITPSDIVSESIMFLPQFALWMILARSLLGPALQAHKKRGGGFRSKWFAAGIGLLAHAFDIVAFLIISLGAD